MMTVFERVIGKAGFGGDGAGSFGGAGGAGFSDS